MQAAARTAAEPAAKAQRCALGVDPESVIAVCTSAIRVFLFLHLLLPGFVLALLLAQVNMLHVESVLALAVTFRVAADDEVELSPFPRLLRSRDRIIVLLVVYRQAKQMHIASEQNLAAELVLD